MPKSCCHFSSKPMRTKLGGNVTPLVTHYIVKKRKFTILNCGKLLQFHLLLTYSRQTWWGCCKFDVECNCWVRNKHKNWIQRGRLPPYWISERCGHFITIKPFLTKHVVYIKYRCAARKTANINVKNYKSLKHGVYRPDSTCKTAKMIYQR